MLFPLWNGGPEDRVDGGRQGRLRGAAGRLLKDGIRCPLAHLRLAGGGRAAGALLCGAPAGRLVQALGEGQRLRIQGILFPDATPPEECTPAFLERFDALRAEDAGWAQRVAEAKETGLEDTLAILDRRLRDAARRVLILGPRHVLPPSLENAAEDAALVLPLRLRQEAEWAARTLASLADQDAANRRDLGLLTLHLVVGILSWGGPDGRKALSTPLLLVPLLLEGACVALPDDGMPPARWLDAIASAAAALPGARLRRVAALANFNLADVLLWRDADPASWGTSLGAPPVARYLGGDGPEGPPRAPAPLLPLPSDATQHAVVARARRRGRSAASRALPARASPRPSSTPSSRPSWPAAASGW